MIRFAHLAAAALLAAPAFASEPAEAVEQTALAPDLFRAPRALEVTATVLGGSYRGPLSENGAGALEVGLGIGWPNFTMGLRFSLDSMSKSLGLGVGGQVGPRFRLGDRARIELLADLGVVSYSDDYEADLIVVSGSSSGSSRTMPSAGLRSGVMLLSRDGRYAVTLGAMFRWTRSATVTYQTSTCLMMVLCGSGSGTAAYGGTMAGAYLTFTRLRPLGT
jgi:hypothetical protein